MVPRKCTSFDVIPVSSILDRILLVPVGSTEPILFDIGREPAGSPGAACDKTKDAGGRLQVVVCQLGPFKGNEATVQ